MPEKFKDSEFPQENSRLKKLQAKGDALTPEKKAELQGLYAKRVR